MTELVTTPAEQEAFLKGDIYIIAAFYENVLLYSVAVPSGTPIENAQKAVASYTPTQLYRFDFDPATGELSFGKVPHLM